MDHAVGIHGVAALLPLDRYPACLGDSLLANFQQGRISRLVGSLDRSPTSESNSPVLRRVCQLETPFINVAEMSAGDAALAVATSLFHSWTRTQTAVIH